MACAVLGVIACTTAEPSVAVMASYDVTATFDTAKDGDAGGVYGVYPATGGISGLLTVNTVPGSRFSLNSCNPAYVSGGQSIATECHPTGLLSGSGQSGNSISLDLSIALGGDTQVTDLQLSGTVADTQIHGTARYSYRAGGPSGRYFTYYGKFSAVKR